MAALALAINFAILIFDHFPQASMFEKWQESIPRIREKLCKVSAVLTLAQVITSLALAIPTLTVMKCTISAYHYNLVCYLCLIASSSYFTTALITYEHTDSRLRGGAQLGFTLGTLVLTIILHYKKVLQTNIFPMFRPHEMPSGNRISTGLVLPAACFPQCPGAASLTGDLANFTRSDRWTEPDSTITNSTEPRLNYFAKSGSNDDLGKAFDIGSSLLVSVAGLVLFMCFIVETSLLKKCCNRNDWEQENYSRSSSSIFKSRALGCVRAVFWLMSIAQLIMETIRFK
ncbi:hypothetical protein EPUS_07735 [Endocarpon pusillum Z07020]|uniref:Uncharacterized protein n=1 Tax=Endocarpon pusillum (strain Z07020 / HMAS-L-300199) TaxID=1263415 RepID=U1HSK4_ENDPU|nr:uncharacterized protein EPUS_07735 [Endocarpon pusillum Z07020]ERF73530.1 hypothetical protein EPUS_07735 [Endocarpon pusillum Z07020]